MFLGYEVDGLLQKDPPEGLRRKMVETLAEELHVTFVDQVNEDKEAG